MPVFNAEDYLEVACESISKQTFKDVELICVDDGSTDESLKKLYELKEKYSFIRIFTQQNQGSGKARNYGMDRAKGEYIAFLDADDIFVDNDALEKMYNFGVKHNADMVGGNLKRVSLEGKLEDNFNYEEGNYAYFSKFDIIKPQEYGIPWAFYKNIFKTEFLNRLNIRFPDLKRGQDPVLLAEVLVNVEEIPVVPVDLYGYNYAAGGGANSKVDDHIKKYDFIKHYKDTFEILENAGFEEISNRYKEKLALHIRLNRNKQDLELQKIFWEIFSDNVIYDKFKENLFNLSINNVLKSLDESNSEDDFEFIKNSFFNMNFVDDYFIPYEILKKYFSVINSYDGMNENISLKAIIKLNKLISNKNLDLMSQKINLNTELQNLKEINQDFDLTFPNLIMEEVVNSLMHEDVYDLKMEILKISLDDSNLVCDDLLKRYLKIIKMCKTDFNEFSNSIKSYNQKLSVENEYLIKQRDYLKKELLDLKK